MLAQLPEKPDDAFVPTGAEFAWAAFWRLHADRPYLVTGFAVAMGATVIEPRAGRIPFSAIDRYARRYGVEGSAFDTFAAIVSAVDNEFMAIEAERAKERAQARG